MRLCDTATLGGGQMNCFVRLKQSNVRTIDQNLVAHASRRAGSAS